VGRKERALRRAAKTGRRHHGSEAFEPSPCPTCREGELQTKATELTNEAVGLLSTACQGIGSPPHFNEDARSLIAQAEQKLAEAASVDAAWPGLHLARSDLANMRDDYAAQVVHARRAVANTLQNKTQQQQAHMCLADAYGNTGDMAGEAAQLKQVLQIDPENLHAQLLSIDQAFVDQGRNEDAVSEASIMSLTLGHSEEGPLSGKQATSLNRFAAHRLKVVSMKQVQSYVDSVVVLHPLLSETEQAACRSFNIAQMEKTLLLLTEVRAMHERFPGTTDDTVDQSVYQGNVGSIHAGNFETYGAIAHLRLGQLSEADEVATLAVNLSEGTEFPENRPFALCTLGNVKERRADEGEDLALYAEAERLYLAAHHAGSDDPVTWECYRRVQAKMSPDWHFTNSPACIGFDMVLPGRAACSCPSGWTPKPLPPRERSHVEK
jgi:tetratricopeptide (TPR) repeat protein